MDWIPAPALSLPGQALRWDDSLTNDDLMIGLMRGRFRNGKTLNANFGANMKRHLISAFILCAALLAPLPIFVKSAEASTLYVEGLPTTWRVQQYVPDVVVAFLTGAPNCPNGLSLRPENSTKADRDRLFNMLMAAKIAKQTVILFYNNNASDCVITSFALKEQAS